MKEALRLKKIVWAINPIEDEQSFHEHAAAALHFFDDVRDLEIRPVYALDPGHFKVSIESDSPWMGSSLEDELKQSARERLNDVLKRYSLPHLKEPVVLPLNEPSSSEAVDAILAYAHSAGGDLIVVNSHGRSGLRRLVEGSFSETLLHRSDIPLLIVAAKSHPSGKLQHILFPTEFDDLSKATFRQTVSLAKEFGAKVTLLHVVPPLDNSSMDFDYGSHLHEYHGKVVTSTKLREISIEEQRRRAKLWASFAANEGVAVEFHIDDRSARIADAILDFAKSHHVSVVMMESKSGPIRSLLIGSNTHRTIRTAECPVLVLTAPYIERHLLKKVA